MNNKSEFNYPKFSNQLRGYAKNQVDMFIEDSADAYAELENENNKLRTKLAKSEAAVEKYRQTIESCDRMTEEASDAADKLRSDARSKSDKLISDTRAKSDAMLAEAREKSAAMTDDARRESESLRSAAEADAAECVRHAREDAYKITSEARLTSDEMSAKCTDTCRRIIAETLVKVASECEVMDALRHAVAEYSAMLCDVYKDQLRHIAELASRAAELPAIDRKTYEDMANLSRLFGIDAKLPDSLGICDDKASDTITHETAANDTDKTDVSDESSDAAAADDTESPADATVADDTNAPTDETATEDMPTQENVPQSEDTANDDFYSDNDDPDDSDDALADSSVARVYGKDDRFISSVITGNADIVRDEGFSDDGSSDSKTAVPDEVARAAAEELDNDMPLPDFFSREVKMNNRPMLTVKRHRRRDLFEDN